MFSCLHVKHLHIQYGYVKVSPPCRKHDICLGAQLGDFDYNMAQRHWAQQTGTVCCLWRQERGRKNLRARGRENDFKKERQKYRKRRRAKILERKKKLNLKMDICLKRKCVWVSYRHWGMGNSQAHMHTLTTVHRLLTHSCSKYSCTLNTHIPMHK